jgi:hypothetical protein
MQPDPGQYRPYDNDQPEPPRHLQAVDAEAAKIWRPQLWPADRIMATEFPPIKWAVPGLLCEGVSLLAGAPKVSKSWLLLSVCLAIASGGRALGSIPVQQGPVLYLALEDTPRRLKSRMGMLLGDEPAPSGLHLATEWPTMPRGGDLLIAEWLDRNPGARMIGIDVLAKVRGGSAAGANAYEADYAAIGRIKKIADNYGVAITVIHHVRKMGSEDFMDTISGTNGVNGAADATLLLRRPRNEADGTLNLTGRDVPENEFALNFDDSSGRWTMLTDRPADEYRLNDTRAAILKCLRESPKPLGPTAVATETGIALDNVKKTMQRMTDAGQIWPAGTGGKYTAPTPGSAPLPGADRDTEL